MQKKIRLLSVVVVATALLSGNAAWAAGTAIAKIPYTINSPGYYYLVGNLTYTDSGNAITVTANDVTLDLGGFSLIGSGNAATRGIYMSGRSNVEIRNGTVTGFGDGIWEDDGANGKQHRVLDIRATNNTDSGIMLYGNGHLINNCLASGNGLGDGFFILGSGLITDCVAANNNVGIWLSGPGSVLGNTAVNNLQYNFILGYSYDTKILVDGNSACCLDTNYTIYAGDVLITNNNGGTP